MACALILHGTKGSPAGNWFPWLKSALEGVGYTVYVPQLPTPEGQNLAAWFDAVASVPLAEDSLVIGHSCGATFALHLLASLKRPVAQAILVSVVIDEIGVPEYDGLNGSFFQQGYAWDKVKDGAGALHILHGENDPYVPLVQAQTVAHALDIPLEIVPDGGHLNEEVGFTSFPRLLEIVK